MLPVGRPHASKLTVASTLLLAGCVLAALALAATAADDEAFYNFMRPRVGYFSSYDPSGTYAKIYEEYFANVIRKNDQAMESLPTDDWRKVRPTGELCVDFLIGLRVKSYVMSKPFELIMLDACLDWLFNEADPLKVEERATDLGRLDSARKLGLKTLTSDAKLREIYQNTRMEDESALPKELLEQIYEYLVRLLHVYSDNPRNGCHSLWLEAYNDFVDDVYVRDCEDESNCRLFGIDGSQNDSYLNMVVESTKQASKTCYNVMQKQIRGLVESEFERSNTGTNSLKKRFMSKTNRVVRQSETEKWAREMISILQLASGVSQDTPVNLGAVANDLYKIKNGDQELIERFTQAISDYAKSNVDLRESKNDGLGRARFGRAMMKLCRPYTDKKMFLSMTGGINMDDDEEGRKPFEFYGLIYSLVRLTNHEQLFDLSKDAFEDEVIKNRWEALYLATFACQIISTTWGELTFESNSGSFDVRLRPEWTLMVADWPIEVLNEKLPILYPKSGSSKSAVKPAEQSSRPADQANKPVVFGKKFKLPLRKYPSNKFEDEQQEPISQLAQSEHSAPAPVAPAPVAVPKPEPVVETPAAQPKPASNSVNSYLPQRNEPKIMSYENIIMYRDMHGRYPTLPDYYKKIYPQLPDDLSGVYPKKAPAPKPSPVTNQSPASGFGGQYGSTGGFGASIATGSAFGGSSLGGGFGSAGGFGANNGFATGFGNSGNSGYGDSANNGFGNSGKGGYGESRSNGFGGNGGFGGNSGFGGGGFGGNSGGFGGNSGSGGGGGFGGVGGYGNNNQQRMPQRKSNKLSALTF